MPLPLARLLDAFERLAPLALAESWDNVGLLLDPRRDGRELEVERVLLTIDATRAVAEEATAADIQCLFAYHPPLFRGVKRLEAANQPLLFEAIRSGFAVYSSHSALDVAAGGVNDWLAEAFPNSQVSPLHPAASHRGTNQLKLVVFVPHQAAPWLRQALAAAGAGHIGSYSECSFTTRGEGTFFGEPGSDPRVGQSGRVESVEELRLEMVCSRRDLAKIAAAIQRAHPYEEPAWDVYPLEPKPLDGVGLGRRVELARATAMPELVEHLKRHLQLASVRVACSEQHRAGKPLSRIALCAGAGGSVFEGVQDCELFVTGEMRHHEVLAKLALGASVVLCEHTHSERGYLPRLRERLVAATSGAVDVLIAATDREPVNSM